MTNTKMTAKKIFTTQDRYHISSINDDDDINYDSNHDIIDDINDDSSDPTQARHHLERHR